MVPLPDDDELRAHTEALIDVPPDIVIATTGIGFRGWVAAADGWGLTNELLAALGKARIVSRGPKATGALRAAGLPEEWSPESESSRELLHYLVDGGIAGLRIAVQLHGATDDWDPFPEFLDELRAAGAEVVPIRVYRWHPAPRNGDFDQLVAGIADERFDAVSFTSAPAVASVLMRAAQMGIENRVLAALRGDVHAMCVGPVTARPLVRLGVPTSAPERMRLGALARHITDELPLLCARTVAVAGHLLQIRGTCVVVDDVVKAVSPAGMATIRALAHRPGAVVSRGDLLGALPGSGTDTHAVETAVLRLRTALGRQEHRIDSREAWLSAGSRRRIGPRVMSLVLVAHGTRKQRGVAMVGDLAQRVSAELGRPVQVAFVDVLGPTPSEVLRELPAERPAIVVPAFLSGGFHVRSDLPAHVAASGHPAVTVTAPLGPCPQTVRVVADRLVECGWRQGDSVVLAAAGTSDPTRAIRPAPHCCTAVRCHRQPGRTGVRGHRRAAGARGGGYPAPDAARAGWWWRHTCWQTGSFKIAYATAGRTRWPTHWAPIRRWRG